MNLTEINPTMLEDYFETFPIPKITESKNCSICLEDFDIESGNKYVNLPCGCSGSTLHIKCIVQWIKSGPNKNYCVQCKKKFEIPILQNQQIQSNQTIGVGNRQMVRILPLRNSVNQIESSLYRRQEIIRYLNDIFDEIEQHQNREQTQDQTQDQTPNLQTPNPEQVNQNNVLIERLREQVTDQKKQIELESSNLKLFLHFLLNSITNLINFGYLCSTYQTLPYKILACFTFIKLIINMKLGMDYKNSQESISKIICFSSLSQFILFMITICINKNFTSNFVLMSQITFFGLDIIFSAGASYSTYVKIKNVIYNLATENSVPENNIQVENTLSSTNQQTLTELNNQTENIAENRL